MKKSEAEIKKDQDLTEQILDKAREMNQLVSIAGKRGLLVDVYPDMSASLLNKTFIVRVTDITINRELL